MTKNVRFKGISLSDIHLGCKRINQLVMNTNLSSFIFPYMEEVDVVFLCGDIFDSPLYLTDNGTTCIIDFLAKFLILADKHNVIVRILRGTFVHDRTQCEMLIQLAKSLELKLDIKYFDTVDVEYIDKLNISVGYIPDSLPYKDSDEVIDILQQKMRLSNKDQLDYVLFHGYMDYVIPENIPIKPKILFNVNQFKFVKKCIFGGHVHQHSSLNNFYYHGSTSRLAFNEETPKGILYFEDLGDSYKVKFVENENTNIFKTYDYSQLQDDDEILDKFKTDLSVINTNVPVYIRVIHSDTNIRLLLRAYTENNYPNFIFTHMAPNAKIKRLSEETISSEIPIDLREYDINTLPSDIKEYLDANSLIKLNLEEITTILKDIAITLK